MFSKVKQHISNNRGKYGTAVGAGAAYGASQIPTVADNVPILANQAIYNGMVKGNNLLQSGKEAIGMNAGPKVNQDEIDMVNGYYNSPLAKVYNPTPGQMIQAGNSTNEFINDTKDNYNNATGYVADKYNQAKDYLGESTMYQNTINIKQALLEGYTAQEIVEAVHVNHPELNKNNSNNINNRANLAHLINKKRRDRDYYRQDTRYPNGSQNYVAASNPFEARSNQAKANHYDNEARVSSQLGGDRAVTGAKEFAGLKSGTRGKSNAGFVASEVYPRVISSAKQ